MLDHAAITRLESYDRRADVGGVLYVGSKVLHAAPASPEPAPT